MGTGSRNEQRMSLIEAAIRLKRVRYPILGSITELKGLILGLIKHQALVSWTCARANPL